MNNLVQNNLVQKYADALAIQLGRPPEELRRYGLRASEFKDTLNFEFQDAALTPHFATLSFCTTPCPGR